MASKIIQRDLPVASDEILRSLKRIDEGLGLVFIDSAKCWAYTIAWRVGDPRFARVQRGELGDGAAYDILGYLPEGCTSDEACAHFVRSVKRWNGSKDEVGALLSKVHHWNKEHEEKIGADVAAYAGELFAANRVKIGEELGQKEVAPVYQSGSTATQKSPTKRKKWGYF